MGQTGFSAIVLDASALIALERGDARMRALCREVLRTRRKLVIPAGVLAQVWRDAARQVPVRAVLGGPTTEVAPLDQILAEAAGILCGRAGASDVGDASVVLVTRRERAVVVTSDAADLLALDPNLSVEEIRLRSP